jgi:hypothetical protein
MSHAIRAIASFGAASALAVGSAGASKWRSDVPTHAVQGVVKSVSHFYLAIVTGTGKRAREMDFVFEPSTPRSGELTIGATVSIRYRLEGRQLVATAVAQSDGRRAIRSTRQH